MPRDHDPQLKAQLDKEVLHLCNCYTLTRTDGVVYNFTDHSESIEVDTTGTGEGALTRFDPNDGAETSATERNADFDAENAEIRGIISSDTIKDDDIRGGKFRDAKITRYLVDWRFPWSGFYEKETFEFGNIAFGSTAYLAQIIGLKARADLRQGRRFTTDCRHVFGSTECGKALTDNDEDGNPITTPTLTVSNISAARKTFFVESKGGNWKVDDFKYGKVSFLTGLNKNMSYEIDSNTAVSQVNFTLSFTLQTFSGFDIAVGDTLTAVQGCTKVRTSCQSRFNNFVNYGGFPYMPNSDRMQQRPKVRQQ